MISIIKDVACRLGYHKVDQTKLPFKVKYLDKKVDYPYASTLAKCTRCGKTVTIDEYGRLV